MDKEESPSEEQQYEENCADDDDEDNGAADVAVSSQTSCDQRAAATGPLVDNMEGEVKGIRTEEAELDVSEIPPSKARKRSRCR